MKKLITLLSLILVCGLANAQFTGTGTSSDPYLISNAGNLTTLATNVNSGGGTTYAGKYFQQTTNINYASASLTPIGLSIANSFSGTYDGNGYSISNFTISGSNFMAVFRYLYSGTIKNLGVTDAIINGSGNYIAALVGHSYLGTIQNCYVSNCDATGYSGVAALVGMSETSTISQCYSSGGTVTSYSAGGGLVGVNAGTISNCYSSTAVTATNGYMGGLAGQNLSAGTITNCYSSGSVGSGTNFVGGLVGNNSSTVTNCYWDKETTGKETSAGSVDSYGKTTTEMKTQSTFTTGAGWDFVTIPIWKIDAAINNGYPFLAFSPTVTTTAISSITTTTASSGGNVTDNGGANVTVRGVCWNTSTAPTTSNSKTTDVSGTGTFTSSLTGLTAGTTYYVRTYATNTAGTSYGNEVSFTALQAPTVTTQAVSSITTTTATGNGNITDLGVPNPTAHGVCWNTTGTPTIADGVVNNGAVSSIGAYTVSMSSLTAGTLYYVRAYATNSVATSYGNEINFTTEALNPPVFTAPLGAFDLSKAEYTGKSFSVSGNTSSPYGVTIDATGTKMYVSGIISNDEVVEYNLSTPFDVTTASFVQEKAIVGRPLDAAFNTDGTKLFLAKSSGTVEEYALSTAYNISTISLSHTLSVTSDDYGIGFSADGTKLYIVGMGTKTIFQYNLSSAFDLSTAISSGKTFTLGTEASDCMDVTFNTVGTKMLVMSISNGIWEYDLGSPFDVSTAVYAGADKGFNPGTEEESAYGMAFNTNGDMFYITGYNTKVYQYKITASVDFAENGTGIATDADANDGNGGADDSGIAYSLASGGDNDLFSINSTSGAITFKSAPDWENPGDSNNDNVYEITVTANDGSAINNTTTLAISIVVTDVNETPTDIALSASAINENAATNSTVGTLSTTDPDAGNTFTYTLVQGSGDTDNASFNISGSSLRLTNSPDFETKSSYSVRIRTTDQGSLIFEKAFTITINDVNEAPSNISLSASSINENVVANSTVGTLSTTDPDAGNTFTYTLVQGSGDTDNASFNISGSSLRLTNSPDFETKSSYSVRIRTTDQGSLIFEKAFTITINDLAEAPSATTNAATSITSTGTTLNGSVNANNSSTAVTFEYGLTTGYGTSVTADQSPVTGSSSTAVSYALSGLTASTTYHYRVVGVNAGGTTNGLDQSFSTSNNPPTFNTTPSVTTVNYGTPYSYGATATVEGDLPTTITAPTLPAWMTFNAAGQSQASLFGNIPSGVYINAVSGDTDGNIFAITSNGTTIYKILPDGTTSVWRTGLYSTYVYALHICDGYIYIPRYGNSTNSLTRIPLSNPSAAEETVTSVSGGILSLTDNGNYLYGTDWNFDVIYKIDKTTKASQVLLNSSNGVPYSGPFGLTFDAAGNLYIATWSNGTILKYNGSTVTTVLSGLTSPSSIRTDKDGNFYISGSSGGVRKYKPDFSSYVVVSNGASDNVWSLSFTANGSLVYSLYSTNKIYRLQTGAVIQGTPAKSDVGDHPVVLRATNDAGYVEQSFTIHVVDNVGPVISTYSPLNNATGVAFQPTLSLTFDEALTLGSTGTLSLYNGATLLKSYDLSISDDKALFTLSPDNLTLSVTLTENLPVNTLVSVGISAGFVKDVHNNNFLGFTAASNTWRFTTINKNEQTITFPAIASKTYGDAVFTLGNATTDQGLTVTYTATVPSVVGISGNQATILKAGTTKITATQTGDNSNFAATPVERTLNVTKAVLTATSDAQTKVFGEANDALTFQYSGWQNGNGIADLATAPTASTTVTVTSPVAVYPGAITVTGGVDENYSFSYVAANYEVTKAVLTVTADAQTKVYGEANDALTIQYSGWQNGNGIADLATAPTAGTTVTVTSPVAVYANAITVSGGVDENYSFSYVAANYEVTKAVLTVTADAQTKVYGEANPTFTFLYSGWVNGVETIDLAPSITTTVDGTTIVGTYTDAITLSGGLDNNYTFSLVPGDLEVTKAVLAVLTATADNQTKVYGEANPTLTFQYSGWVNGVETIDTPPSITTTVDGTTVVGTYADAITLSGGSDNNYTFSLVSGDLEVTKAVLTATADNQTKVYGEANPTLTISWDGFVNGEDQTVLIQAPEISVDTDNNSNAGVYDITVSGGEDNNYTFQYNKGILTIMKADQLITFEDIPEGLRTTQEHQLVATSTSFLPVVFSTSEPAIATISGTDLKVEKEGTVQITASQTGDNNWNPAPDVIQSIITLVTFDNISSLFTPNNDGMNDYWYIPNLIEFGNVHVTVYNRFGQAVYKSDSYKNNWDGTWNGYPLPSASYYYIIKSTEKGIIKGIVNLVR